MFRIRFLFRKYTCVIDSKSIQHFQIENKNVFNFRFDQVDCTKNRNYTTARLTSLINYFSNESAPYHQRSNFLIFDGFVFEKKGRRNDDDEAAVNSNLLIGTIDSSTISLAVDKYSFHYLKSLKKLNPESTKWLNYNILRFKRQAENIAKTKRKQSIFDLEKNKGNQ